VDVAKKSKGKTSRGGKKTAYRQLEDGYASAELIGKKTGRKLQQTLFDKSPVDQYLGPAGVKLARSHHQKARAELLPNALRLSKGEPAIPTIYG
jgi:nicotinate phosphoribosyltransferase